VRDLLAAPPGPILRAALHVEALDTRLAEFAATGGLPRAVADLLATGSVRPSTLDEVWRLVLSDVVRLGRSDATAQKLLARMVVSLGGPMSWPDLAGEMGVAGQTAEAYTDLLARAFVVLVLHQADLKQQGGPSLRRRRKLYFVDPLTARLPAHLGGPVADLPRLVENVMAMELFRRVEQPAVERFAVPSALYLWRSSNDREVDFVARLEPDLAIESKYARSITGKDRESLVKAFGGGVIASRTTVQTDGPVRVIPAGVLLSLLAP
jgi:predicted AAA+ superfamily ATPase